MRWVLILIAVSLVWYLLADRFTPYTQQARLQAYVVPVAAEVAGQIKRVAVGNNQEVRQGDVLFELDQEQYRIALARAEADLDTVRRQIGASTAGIDSAQAALVAAQANERKARQDAERLKRLIDEDPGTVSVRRLEGAQATRDQAISQVAAARAEVERAREQQGGADADNAQLRSAAANVEKARLDLARTVVRADANGLITDLRTDVGHYVGAGSPMMTLITIHDVWISADMTENNLGRLRPGAPVLVVLDA
jgi:multidrug resistance efflux pump